MNKFIYIYISADKFGDHCIGYPSLNLTLMYIYIYANMYLYLYKCICLDAVI